MFSTSQQMSPSDLPSPRFADAGPPQLHLSHPSPSSLTFAIRFPQVNASAVSRRSRFIKAASRFAGKPRCPAPSLRRSRISSSTVYTTIRKRSKHVALSPNAGSIGREATCSITSNSAPEVATSASGGKLFLIPRTPQLILRAFYPSTLSTPSPPQMRTHYSPFVAFHT